MYIFMQFYMHKTNAASYNNNIVWLETFTK